MISVNNNFKELHSQNGFNQLSTEVIVTPNCGALRTQLYHNFIQVEIDTELVICAQATYVCVHVQLTENATSTFMLNGTTRGFGESLCTGKSVNTLGRGDRGKSGRFHLPG